MGLDMYLTGKQYVSTYDYNEKDVVLQKTLQSTLAKIHKEQDRQVIPYQVQYIEYKIMQWRKANQIHKWFVDNVQDGEDDCREYYVDEEQCKELLRLCNIVIDNRGNLKKTQETLPPQSGFFFGSTEVDEYYYEDIKETAIALKAVLDSDLHANLEIYYSSSW